MTATNYAKALYELEIPANDIFDACEIINENPELARVLANPAVSAAQKHKVIDGVFPESVHSFLKYLCDRSHSGELSDIVREYSRYRDSMEGIIRASLVCVIAPDEAQLERIKTFICNRFGGKEAQISISYDKSLIGGFILTADGVEFDRSLKSSLEGLKNSMKRSV